MARTRAANGVDIKKPDRLGDPPQPTQNTRTRKSAKSTANRQIAGVKYSNVKRPIVVKKSPQQATLENSDTSKVPKTNKTTRGQKSGRKVSALRDQAARGEADEESEEPKEGVPSSKEGDKREEKYSRFPTFSGVDEATFVESGVQTNPAWNSVEAGTQTKPILHTYVDSGNQSLQLISASDEGDRSTRDGAGASIASPVTRATQDEETNSLDSQKLNWRKLNGDDRYINRRVIPEGVIEGRITKRFPHALRSRRNRGLRNVGNSCYRNAVLQALMHMPVFYQFLGNCHKDCNIQADNCVTCVLQEITHVYWNLPEAANPDGELDVLMTELLVALRAEVPADDDDFGAPGSRLRDDINHKSLPQSDAFEFAQVLVELLQARCYADFSSMQEVDAVFKSSTRRVWTCPSCRGVNSTTLPPQFGMSVTIPRPEPIDLVRRIRADMKENAASGYTCNTDGCGTQRAKKFDRIIQAPEILMVRLLRFRLDGSRNGDHVNFPELLILTEHEDTELSVAERDGTNLVYRLDAVVYHGGWTIDSGHYTAAVRSVSGRAFIRISDDKIDDKLYQCGDIRAHYQDGKPFDPYVLFYSKA